CFCSGTVHGSGGVAGTCCAKPWPTAQHNKKTAIERRMSDESSPVKDAELGKTLAWLPEASCADPRNRCDAACGASLGRSQPLVRQCRPLRRNACKTTA